MSLIAFMVHCTIGIDPTQTDIINRNEVVSRHNVQLSKMDTLGSLTVGNGSFAYTVDITGLQSFPKVYEQGITLGTQSEWGWHSTPNSKEYAYSEVLENYVSCDEHVIPIAIQHKYGRKRDATTYFRQNPHRLHLGLIGLQFLDEQGSEIGIEGIRNPNQVLDLWTGKITSAYSVDNRPVRVELYAHQEQDAIAFKISSDLLAIGRLKVTLQFPYGQECHVCPGYDWNHPEKHSSVLSVEENRFQILRILDNDQYTVKGEWEETVEIQETAKHFFEVTAHPGVQELTGVIRFAPTEILEDLPDFTATARSSRSGYENYWTEGGIMDFSECTDTRATELERRVILSQYLMKVNCSGHYPPQETGLTMNSWFGKFHLEMHWWHAVHFAYWDRTHLLAKSMPWYHDILDQAKSIAERQGFLGVRWPKMTSLDGLSSPSSVGEFLIWQQPHPIYFAELIYSNSTEDSLLYKYRDIVFATADFMASFAQYDGTTEKYHLCQPIIPAQEIFHATETNDPIFELVYWHWALERAIQWKERLGEEIPPLWQTVSNNLADLPQYNGLYLPCAGATEAYSDPDNRRDHPIVTGALGVLPKIDQMDEAMMKATFEEVMRNWQLGTTWGWDYPMLAMCAARLNRPEDAIDALFMNANKNTYLVNGHNYQDKRLRLYLPGNGGLLTAVAMMVAGWEGGPDNINPGFPDNGKWSVKWEGLRPML